MEADSKLWADLAEPFDPAEVKWKPAMVKGDRCMVLCYIDARCVMDRLDEVLGPDCWQDDYEVLNDGACVCRLKVRLGGEWIVKTDVGSESEQPDEHDRRKASFSDALKRAAVKLGIGRYLYRLPQQWVDYDAKAKRPATRPQLPAWAVPGRRPGAPVTVPAEADAAPAPPPRSVARPVAPPPPPPPTQKPQAEKAQASLGERFLARLVSKSNELEAAGLAEAGELVDHVRTAGGEARFPENLQQWKQEHISVAAGWVVEFEDGARKAAKAAGERAPLSLPQKDMESLALLLARKGARLVEVAKLAGAKTNALIEELTPGQAGLLTKILTSMPDAKE